MRLVTYLAPGFPAALFEALADCLGATVAFETEMSGPPPGEDPFADGTYDAGWVCSTSFVDLALRGPDPSVRLAGVAWVPNDPDAQGQPVYFGDIVVPGDSDVQVFEDLAGVRMGCNDPVSLSGNYALQFALRDRELDADFCQTRFTGGHNMSLDQLAGGTLDAAVVDSVIRTSRARTEPAIASMRVIERLGPWPVQPLVIRRDMPEAERTSIVDALLSCGQSDRIRAVLDEANLSHLVPVADDHYAAVRAAMAAI